jgi:hypothetical protein
MIPSNSTQTIKRNSSPKTISKTSKKSTPSSNNANPAAKNSYNSPKQKSIPSNIISTQTPHKQLINNI